MKQFGVLGITLFLLTGCCYEQKSTPIVHNSLSINTLEKEEPPIQEEPDSAQSLVIEELGPSSHAYKEKITLSNGVTYKIYPYHGWNLEGWSIGQDVWITYDPELSYTVMLTNPKTQDSIRAKQI